MVSAVRRSQHGHVVRRSHAERPTGVTRAVALLLLLPVAAAHGIHAYAQGRAANAGQSRADFLGTTLYSAAGCSNGLTCGPSYCVRGSNSEAVNNKANMTGAYRTCGCSAGARTPPGCACAGRTWWHIIIVADAWLRRRRFLFAAAAAAHAQHVHHQHRPALHQGGPHGAVRQLPCGQSSVRP